MIGELISAGANLLGGFLNRDAAKDANEKAAAERQKDRELQWKMAEQGVRIKAADARAAGLHPLFAMGASTPSFTPLAIGQAADTSMGSSLAAAGQDIGRAFNATRTTTERADAYTKAAQTLQLENSSLQNQLLAAQIAKLNANANPPMQSADQRYLIDGQGQTALPDTNLLKEKPMERTPSAPTEPSQEPAAITDVGHARTKTGWAPVPSKDVKERIEDNLIQEVMWAVRNNLLPSLGMNQSPPAVGAGQDRFWAFDPWRQEYRRARGMRRGQPIWD